MQFTNRLTLAHCITDDSAEDRTWWKERQNGTLCQIIRTNCWSTVHLWPVYTYKSQDMICYYLSDNSLQNSDSQWTWIMQTCDMSCLKVHSSIILVLFICYCNIYNIFNLAFIFFRFSFFIWIKVVVVVILLSCFVV